MKSIPRFVCCCFSASYATLKLSESKVEAAAVLFANSSNLRFEGFEFHVFGVWLFNVLEYWVWLSCTNTNLTHREFRNQASH